MINNNQNILYKKYFNFGFFFIFWMIFFDTNSLITHYNLLKDIENMEYEKIYLIKMIDKEKKIFINICNNYHVSIIMQNYFNINIIKNIKFYCF